MIVGVSHESHERELLDSALGGFVVLLSLNGKVIFTTKGVTTHTGINQVMTLKTKSIACTWNHFTGNFRKSRMLLFQMDLIGRSLFEFLHPCDQMEVKDLLTRLIGERFLLKRRKFHIFVPSGLQSGIFQETEDSKNVTCSSE